MWPWPSTTETTTSTCCCSRGDARATRVRARCALPRARASRGEVRGPSCDLVLGSMRDITGEEHGGAYGRGERGSEAHGQHYARRDRPHERRPPPACGTARRPYGRGCRKPRRAAAI